MEFKDLKKMNVSYTSYTRSFVVRIYSDDVECYYCCHKVNSISPQKLRRFELNAILKF